MAHGAQIEAGLLTLVMISAGLAVGGRRRVLLAVALLLVPTLLAQWSHRLFPHLVSPVAHLVMGILFMGFVVTHLLRFILRGLPGQCRGAMCRNLGVSPDRAAVGDGLHARQRR